MEIKKIKIGDNEIEFVNESYNTRNGFKHVSTMFINGIEKRSHTCHYYNRTWECYRYQMVMMGLVMNRLNDIIEYAKTVFKENKGYKKMTADRYKEFENYLSQNEQFILHNKILEELR